MGATTIAAIDPMPKHLGLVMTFKAGEAITAGAAVAYAATGLDFGVVNASQATGPFVGIALISADSGAPVTVGMDGTVCKVILSATDTDIDAGHWLMLGSVAGTFIEFDPAILDHAAAPSGVQGTAPCGKALSDDVAGAGTVGATLYMLVQPAPILTTSA